MERQDLVSSVGGLRVLVAHNAYQQRGGEDSVVDAESALLTSRGHEVLRYTRHNDELKQLSALSAAAQMLWSKQTVTEVEKLFDEYRPSVLHVHNTFPLMSPALYWAAAKSGVPVVQTLHNFRLHCPQAMYLRNGAICEDCLGKIPWRGAVRGCYRGSKAQSTALTGMLMTHRILGTWDTKVTRYIALNEFCRDKFVAGGLPAEKIVIKPNFVDFPAPESESRSGFLFVGRLSVEKGVKVLVDASLRVSEIVVKVAGTGPESSLLDLSPAIQRLGHLSGDQVRREMAGSMALVLPSIWYENFPMTLVEAMGCGLPIIASRIGALASLVEDGVTGLLFAPGDATDLAEKMRWANANPAAMAAMGRAARHRYEENYTAARNYEQLVAVYKDAIAAQRAGDNA